MKKVVLVVIGVLLAMVILSGGCAPKATTPPPAPAQTVTGVLTDVNTPAETGAGVVTIQTPQGPQTFAITPSTQIFLEGQICGLDDLAKVLVAGNESYTCTLLYDYEDNAITLNVLKENK